MFNGLYKGKRVFVTGHTGFKGSWLTAWLTMMGADVAGYALAPDVENSHFGLLQLEKEIKHQVADIRNFEALKNALNDFKPEIIFHLAAQALVRPSYIDPKETMDTNIGGSINLLEAVRKMDCVRALVFVTSDKCYRNHEWLWGYRENDELGGEDPYSASKAATELVFHSYLVSFLQNNKQLGAASVRAGNVIGGGDRSQDRIVPDCVRAITRNEKIIIRNPVATRPWQHVLEPLSGYLLLAQNLFENPKKYSGAWNFGPDDESVHTVADLADSIISKWGFGELYFQVEANAPHEAGLLHLDSGKARRGLGWKPKWNFEQTVAKTVAWYKADVTKADMRAITMRQIKEYMGQ